MSGETGFPKSLERDPTTLEQVSADLEQGSDDLEQVSADQEQGSDDLEHIGRYIGHIPPTISVSISVGSRRPIPTSRILVSAPQWSERLVPLVGTPVVGNFCRSETCVGLSFLLLLQYEYG